MCPGWVRTGILDADRNRPNTLQNLSEKSHHHQVVGNSRNVQAEMEAGMSPAEVADHVYNAIQTGTFYITHILNTKRGFVNVWKAFLDSTCPILEVISYYTKLTRFVLFSGR